MIKFKTFNGFQKFEFSTDFHNLKFLTVCVNLKINGIQKFEFCNANRLNFLTFEF